MARRVLITGGAGFIGSNLAGHLASNGDKVYVIDNLSTAAERHDLFCEEFLRADLATLERPAKVELMIKYADVVYHLASSVGVKHVDKDPKHAIRNSFDINNRLFPLFEKHHSRVIFASTSEVYGDCTTAKETDTLRIGPTDTLRWGYACGKLMSEFLLKSYSFPHTVARFFNVSGRGQVDTHGMVLPTFVNRAKADQDLVVYGTGTQSRSFCDIRDAVEMLELITTEQHVNETYNIGNSDNMITMYNLAQLVKDVVGSNSRIVRRDYKQDFSDQHADIHSRRPNTQKMDQHYKAKYSIEEMIRDML